MRINHNIAALNTHRQLNSATAGQMKSMEKLSSGLRINKAGDDAAGLAISEKMRAQVRGLDQASRNAQDSISMIQTAEGALNETHDILQRMRELAVQAGNDTNTGSDRGEIQKEINQLTSEINRIGNTTEFNGQKLLNATDGVVTGGSPAVPGAPAVPAAATSNQTNGTSGEVTFTDATTFTGSSATWTLATADGTAFTLDKGDGAGANPVTFTSGSLTVDGLELNLPTTPAAGDSWELDVTAATPAGTGTPAIGASSSFSTQIGANENQTMTLEFSDMRAAALGLTGTASSTGFTATDTVTDGTNNSANAAALDVSTAANAGNAVTAINNAIEAVSAERSKLGANQNRLEHTINNLNTSSENLTAAESRIRDVDMAKEMMEQTKNSILAQASQAMLAQANQQPQGVLQLLR
ncbi:flagellin [Bacillus sp. LL01]|uniref:flagellin N-terminal helical domain-containing protein n=1 Tax=Bacillus sp. LL01 TaxID=1665556 RepID=UPI00064D0EFB|nr:flagellin [Bacillus sp. LL01]KMJ58995.1 flagellin [Bacillus sp. LL01]